MTFCTNCGVPWKESGSQTHEHHGHQELALSIAAIFLVVRSRDSAACFGRLQQIYLNRQKTSSHEG
jgi:hypothetical protein